jgi:N-acetylglutamate synthase-like GNAT family acetyltransferase
MALARHLGPVARVLIKRAAADGISGEVLLERLAARIEDAGARRVFEKEGKEVLF